MKFIQNFVCDRELAERLKKLGYPQESVFWWRSPLPHHGYNEWTVSDCQLAHGATNIAAPTAGELGEKLPTTIIQHEKEKWLTCRKMPDGKWRVGYFSLYAYSPKNETGYNTLANAMAKMAIYLAEQGIIKLWELYTKLP